MGATHRGEESMFLIWEPITGTETLEHHWSDVTGDHSPNPAVVPCFPSTPTSACPSPLEL
eukprot:1188209-Prorocentrum_minimum.AAC.1